MRNSETGRASKLQAFAKLITFTKGQVNYAPPTDDLQVEALNALMSSAEAHHQKVNSVLAECQMAKSKRNKAFTPLSATARSVKDFAAAMDMPADLTAGLKRLCDAITGNRKLSQLGFESRIDHFSKMIEILKGIDTYNPSRPEIQIAGLEATLLGMQDAMKTVNTSEVALKTAQHEQNILFSGDDGLFGITRRVKLYLKSLFGARAPLYKEVVRITKVIRQ